MAEGEERARDRPATIHDVARLAGVSHITVSRFLHGYEGMRPETREKVERAVAELRYRPNLVARSLVTNRPHQLAALVHEISDSGPGRVIHGASEAAREAGYALDMITLDPLDDAIIAEAMGLLSMQHIAGVVATAPTARVRDAIIALGASVAQPIELARQDESDWLERGVGPAAAVEHLVALGHRRIVHIAGPVEWTAAADRVVAYETVLQRAGLPVLPVLHGDWSAASSYAVAAAVPVDGSVTAVFAANDRMALGAMKRLGEGGMRVPADISVIGYDDIPEAEFLDPALTTCRQDFDAIGRQAALRLIARVEGRDPVQAAAPEPQLIVRGSTAPPRPGFGAS